MAARAKSALPSGRLFKQTKVRRFEPGPVHQAAIAHDSVTPFWRGLFLEPLTSPCAPADRESSRHIAVQIVFAPLASDEIRRSDEFCHHRRFHPRLKVSRARFARRHHPDAFQTIPITAPSTVHWITIAEERHFNAPKSTANPPGGTDTLGRAMPRRERMKSSATWKTWCIISARKTAGA